MNTPVLRPNRSRVLKHAFSMARYRAAATRTNLPGCRRCIRRERRDRSAARVESSIEHREAGGDNHVRINNPAPLLLACEDPGVPPFFPSRCTRRTAAQASGSRSWLPHRGRIERVKLAGLGASVNWLVHAYACVGTKAALTAPPQMALPIRISYQRSNQCSL
jgi:hypothetical protein